MAVRTLVMVDDDPFIRRVAQLSLCKVGSWQVVLAGSAKEAIALLAVCRPDVILLDVMMPEMDGPTLLCHIRNIKGLQFTPVIFMTAKIQSHEVERYLKMDAAGVISKPFDPMTLSQEIDEILSGVAA